jgi:hypothetical protein
MALNVSCATFNPDTFCWHLPSHLAYGATGSLEIVGDVHVHAATGAFISTGDEAVKEPISFPLSCLSCSLFCGLFGQCASES